MKQFELHVAVRRLVDSRAFETSIERTRVAMALADATLPDCPLVYVNPAFGRLTGYYPADILGKNCRFLQGPKTDRQAVKRIRAAIDGRTDIEEVIYNYRRDGSGFWNALFLSPVYNEAGTLIYFFSSQIDITTQRSLQERQVILLAELQHRTRNLLAVVEAISRQTLSRSGSLDAFAANFEGRLGALSRVQGLLAWGSRKTLDLRTLVQTELKAHGAEDPARVQVRGPDLELPAEAVQVLALALHELATNAVKHGAIGQPAGHLSIEWQVTRVSGGDCLALMWCESGVAMPATADRVAKGYGRELIEQALPYQLSATTTFNYGSDGVCCSIILPFMNTEPEQDDD